VAAFPDRFAVQIREAAPFEFLHVHGMQLFHGFESEDLAWTQDSSSLELGNPPGGPVREQTLNMRLDRGAQQRPLGQGPQILPRGAGHDFPREVSGFSGEQLGSTDC
jgi:hypothetical protein